MYLHIKEIDLSPPTENANPVRCNGRPAATSSPKVPTHAGIELLNDDEFVTSN